MEIGGQLVSLGVVVVVERQGLLDQLAQPARRVLLALELLDILVELGQLEQLGRLDNKDMV
jgi:hypothetical protein